MTTDWLELSTSRILKSALLVRASNRNKLSVSSTQGEVTSAGFYRFKRKDFPFIIKREEESEIHNSISLIVVASTNVELGVNLKQG